MAESSDAPATTIQRRIQYFFEAQGTNDPEQVRMFVGHLYDSYIQAEHATNRAFLGVVTVALLHIALAKGLVNEASVLSFKLVNIQVLLLLGPPGIGFFSYVLAGASFASINLGAALRAAYKHMLPNAYEQDLEALIGPPTIIRIEAMFKTGEAPVVTLTRMITLLILLAVATVGTGAAIAYASYLLIAAKVAASSAAVLSVAVAIALYVRSLMLWWATADF